MQLTYQQAPTNGVEVLSPAIQAALQTQGFGVNPRFVRTATDRISLSEAYRGYTLSLDDLAQGKGLTSATPGDWHYLVFSNGVTIADAQLTEESGQAQFSSLNHGNTAAATIDALNLAENSTQLQGKTFELRMLFIPALHVMAIWLHAEDRDVLIPIEPTPKDLAATQLYDEASLFALLIPAAKLAKKGFGADSNRELGS